MPPLAGTRVPKVSSQVPGFTELMRNQPVVGPGLTGVCTTLLKPVTMSLFGMVNWHYLWFKGGGPVTRADYADLVTRLIADGTRDLVTQPVTAPKRAVARRR